jgi:hypothetical protein
MKLYLTLLFLYAFICTITAQKVGVNKELPEHTLDVRSISNTEAAGLNLSNMDKSKNIRFFSGNATFPDPSVSWAPSYSLLFATFDDNTMAFNEYMRIASTGKVGIGIDNPIAQLDVLGTGTGINGEGSDIGMKSTGEIGVSARSNSTTGSAIYAYSSSSTGSTKGIHVDVNSPDGIGVQASGPKYGVYGFASAANHFGI